jgi:hypothetical protein
MSEPVRILDWYRADQARSMLRVLTVGAVSMTASGLVIAVSFLTHQAEQIRQYAAGIGIVLVASSAAFTSVTMRRILRHEESVVLRTDGLAVQTGGTETFIPWAELDAARWDAERGLVLDRRAAAPFVVAWRPARITGPDLAARIEHEKKRAEMGLLK